MPEFRTSELRQAARALDQAGRYPPMGVRPLNGEDLCSQALIRRQARLQALLERFGCPAVSASEAFADGIALLRAAEEHRLEGVVSKRRDAPYRSGDCRDWRKVKTATWREANSDRWRLFERGGLLSR